MQDRLRSPPRLKGHATSQGSRSGLTKFTNNALGTNQSPRTKDFGIEEAQHQGLKDKPSTEDKGSLGTIHLPRIKEPG